MNARENISAIALVSMEEGAGEVSIENWSLRSCHQSFYNARVKPRESSDQWSLPAAYPARMADAGLECLPR
jgi:hypothetical protein